MYTETGGSMAESIDLTGMNIPNHIAIIMDGKRDFYLEMQDMWQEQRR